MGVGPWSACFRQSNLDHCVISGCQEYILNSSPQLSVWDTDCSPTLPAWVPVSLQRFLTLGDIPNPSLLLFSYLQLGVMTVLTWGVC